MVTPNVQLVELIGEGAMGSVWVANHLTLETRVAVKFIHEGHELASEEALARFRREASAAAKIRSQHVVQTYDQGVMDDGTPYIVMELLEGESLAQRLDRTGRLTLRQTAQIVSQVAKALHAAHSVGIVHRDIKPENIYLVPVDEGKLIKVLDFGIAKLTKVPESRRLTQEGLLIGTPEYICRDQMIKACDVNAQSDLWALAVVAYECLTGQLPFEGATIGAICASIIATNFMPPTMLRDDLPADADAWFVRALHQDPAARFPSAKDMALAFVRVLPTRVDDIAADLADSSAQFSVYPVAPKDGTIVGMPPPGGLTDGFDSDLAKPGARATRSGDVLPSGGKTHPVAAPAGSGGAGASARPPSGTFANSTSDLPPPLPVGRRPTALLASLGVAALLGAAAAWLVVRSSADPGAGKDGAVPSAAETRSASGLETAAEVAGTATATAATTAAGGVASGEPTRAPPSGARSAAPTPIAKGVGASPPPSSQPIPPPTQPSASAAPKPKPPAPPNVPPKSTSPEALGF